MTSPRFLIESVPKVGTDIELPRNVAHHAQHVLRLADGAEIILFNGSGGQWRTQLVAGKRARATITAFEPVDHESPLALTVLQAWIAVDKLDWVVEKATELGVAQIVLVPAERSQVRLAGDRLQRRLIHLREVAAAACAQCGRNKLLAIAAVMAALLVTVSVFSSGSIAMWSILAVGLFNSIMFPCIFTMGIEELGPLTNAGSAMLNMAIVGGAIIPWVVGKIGDVVNHRYYPDMFEGATSWGQGIHYALILAAVCYVYILFFAVSGSKPNSRRHAKA